jgi:hypothetical protein
VASRPEADLTQRSKQSVELIVIHEDEPTEDDEVRPSCMYRIVTAPCFNFFIFILILLNTLVLSMDDYHQNHGKTLVISVANQVFTWTFFLEMCLKIWGLGPRNYVKDSFNQFDAFVVTISIIDWVIAITID